MQRSSPTKREGDKDELIMLRKAVEASGEVIFLSDREGVITYINPHFTRLYGYTADEVIGKTTPRILKSGLMTREDYEIFWRKLLEKQVFKGLFVNKCKDGTLVTIEGSANPILDEGGDIVGFLAIQRDIGKRKQAEDALTEAHAFQQSIIDGVAEPIMVIDTDFRVQLMNRAAREISSKQVDTSKPLFCYQISHQLETRCDGIDHPCPLEQVQQTNQPVTFIHKHYHANGEGRILEVIATPYRNSDGSFQGIIESMRDITERKNAEDALQQYADRLRALTAQLTEVEDSERQRLARELHDQVGQNLTALGINLNIIQSQLPDEVPESLSFRLDDSLLLVQQTTEQIRDLMSDLRPPVLDDYGLIDALNWYGDQFNKRTNIAVLINGEEPMPRLPQRVEIALFRIAQEALTNVSKHAKASCVSVSLEAENDKIRMVISDDGIGFNPLQAAEYEAGRGWGLLAMTERAEVVGARCRIKSLPDQGTKVIVDVER